MEDDLVLDDEDLQFLEQDIEESTNNNTEEELTVIIDPADESKIPSEEIEEVNRDEAINVAGFSKKALPFKWEKADETVVNDVPGVEFAFEFGKVLINTTEDPTPYEVFLEVSKFF